MTTDTAAISLADNEGRARRLLDRDWAFLIGGRPAAGRQGQIDAGYAYLVRQGRRRA